MRSLFHLATYLSLYHSSSPLNFNDDLSHILCCWSNVKLQAPDF